MSYDYLVTGDGSCIHLPTQREIDIFIEHASHGIAKSEAPPTENDTELWLCPCGWYGYIRKGEVTDGNENVILLPIEDSTREVSPEEDT